MRVSTLRGGRLFHQQADARALPSRSRDLRLYRRGMPGGPVTVSADRAGAGAADNDGRGAVLMWGPLAVAMARRRNLRAGTAVRRVALAVECVGYSKLSFIRFRLVLNTVGAS